MRTIICNHHRTIASSLGEISILERIEEDVGERFTFTLGTIDLCGTESFSLHLEERERQRSQQCIFCGGMHCFQSPIPYWTSVGVDPVVAPADRTGHRPTRKKREQR